MSGCALATTRLPGGGVLLDPLALLAVVPVLVAIVARSRRRAGVVGLAPLAVAVLGAEGEPLPTSWRVRLRRMPTWLEGAGFLVAVVALARPAWPVTGLPPAPGLDIVLGLDVSSSMAARDLDPSRTRLDVARAAAARFVAGRPRDRVGLVTFARYPDVLAAPTPDQSVNE